ncbi:MAG TPA: elongation factor G [Phycisphaerae bacterium]|nr:elongation factor G [Phycisphaerae bacterium]HNU45335.1 elongation factor G [Phycisphaerae bacterium]
MALVEVDKYRNMVLVGHGGSGKTTLAEALLFKAGMTTRQGSVPDRSSILDATDEEQEKLSSLDSALCYLTHKGLHVNLVVTPGDMSFCGPAVAALAAAECAVLVISASAGIQVNTRKMFERSRDYGLAIWVVVNHIDAPNVDLPGLLGQIQEQFGPACVPLTLPTKGAKAVVDCFAHESGEADFLSVADAHTKLIDAIVSADEALMEKYLGGELNPDEARQAAGRAVATRELIPVFFSSARAGIGITEFLDNAATFCPSPLTGKRRVMGDGEESVEIEPKAEGPFIGQVFKIRSDPKTHIKYVSIRGYTGRLTSDQTLRSTSEPKGVRPGQILRTFGLEQRDEEAGVAGDIFSLAKLDLSIGDVVYTQKAGPIAMPSFPKPMYSFALVSKSRGDEDKIGVALKRFAEEDPCFRTDRPATGELVIRGMGDTQLRTYLTRMAKSYKLEVETKPPRIPYRETVTNRVDNVEYTHKKQTGGAGQYGKIVINLVPATRGEGYEFVDKIFGGAIDQSFRPSVDKGVRAQMAEGVLAGYPVVDVKVELIDGKTHPVDSKDIAFQIAGRGAFKEAFGKGKPVLLEPIVQIEVTCPADKVGDIQGDLASRRGRPQGQDMLPGNMAIVRALVPLAEVADYNSRLSSITGGQGSYALEESHYEVVPGNVQQQIIEAAKREKAGENG